MIEELQDFLVRRGLSETTAGEVHDAYLSDAMRGVQLLAVADDRLVGLVAEWMEESGEAAVAGENAETRCERMTREMMEGL